MAKVVKKPGQCCTTFECPEDASSSTSSSSGDNLPTCKPVDPTAPKIACDPAPPLRCPEGSIKVWFGSPPAPRKPICKNADGSLNYGLCNFPPENPKRSQVDCRLDCSSPNEKIDIELYRNKGIDETEYVKKCGNNPGRCEIKGAYGELCMSSSVPSPQPQTYKKEFDCYKPQAGTGKTLTTCELRVQPGTQNMTYSIDRQICGWKDTPELNKCCLSDAYNEDFKIAMSAFIMQSGCSMQSGVQDVFVEFLCKPSTVASKEQFCKDIIALEKKTLPYKRTSVFRGQLDCSLIMPKFQYVEPTSGSTITCPNNAELINFAILFPYERRNQIACSSK